MRNEGLDKAEEYAMRFHWFVIFLILERHPGIDLSEINFGSLRGNNVIDPNDGSIVALDEEASGEEDEGGSDVVGTLRRSLVLS